MKTGYKIILGIIGGLILYQIINDTHENIERRTLYQQARAFCDGRQKPLLVVGMKRHWWQPPDGDITIDIDPLVEQIPGGVLADERNIPFDDKTFGACYNAHTLEHMATITDMEKAITECLRVADRVYFLVPSWYSITANFLCASHHLRMKFDQSTQSIYVAPNNFPKFGLGHTGGQYEGPVMQSLVVENMPDMIIIE